MDQSPQTIGQEPAAAAAGAGPNIQVSQAALDRVAVLLVDEPAGTMLRVSVEGGGCSGFQYKYELVTERLDDDIALGDERVTVLIDSVSVPYLAGSIIDYKVSLMGAAFEIENPQATASCGCGTSFSI
ncbi:MAG: iron-sulfur cluster assembly accessory protein [Devosiaceae bacterium]|nr:iron-sulfur cluster assembly accessory protein [Devosiaceae bacterium MH13]